MEFGTNSQVWCRLQASNVLRVNLFPPVVQGCQPALELSPCGGQRFSRPVITDSSNSWLHPRGSILVHKGHEISAPASCAGVQVQVPGTSFCLRHPVGCLCVHSCFNALLGLGPGNSPFLHGSSALCVYLANVISYPASLCVFGGSLSV